MTILRALALAGLLILTMGPKASSATPERPACRAATFEGDGFVVCRYDPARDELRLVNGGPDSLPALKAALGDDALRVAFAMNAGMYEPDRSPVGLFVTDGAPTHGLNTRDSWGNFYLKPNGVFWLDEAGAPHVDETGAFAALDARPAWATQSGPLLFKAGTLHPSIMPNGTSTAVRNAVGIKGDEALFVISNEPVSFGRLARFMRDELGCDDALYFDGNVSSLWAPALERMDERTGLGTFVVVLSKAYSAASRDPAPHSTSR